jgi:hypothetical protein
MGFTIIFWVIAATALTLFIVKWIYYEMYLKSPNGPWVTKRLLHFATRGKFRTKERIVRIED